MTGTTPDADQITSRSVPLNCDILLNVVAQCDSRRTAFALISTCRILNVEGAKILLRKHIWLHSQDGFHSFLLFLSNHPDSRPQHVRDLHLLLWSLPSQLAQLFHAICPSMTGLASLTISSLDVVVDPYPSLLYSLAQLKQLQHLSIPFAEERACTLLRMLHAPLRSVKLSWSTDSGSFWDTLDEDEWPLYHPTILLENFTDTLEELECGFWSCTEDYLSPRKIFPKLRRLIVENIDIFYVAPYVLAFPNLAHISSYTLNFEEAYMEYQENAERFCRHRERNVSQQLHPRSTVGGCTWQRIQVFEGPLFDFYYLYGLLCPITRLALHHPLSDNNGYLPGLSQVLFHARPRHLEYRTTVNDTFDGIEYLCAGLLEGHSPAWSRLETFAVEFGCELRSFKEGESFAQVMENLAAATRRLPLHQLKLTVSTVSHGYSGYDRLIGKPPPPLTGLELMAEMFALKEFAVRLVNDMPSLREMEISIARPRHPGRRVATLGTTGDGLGSRTLVYAE